MNFIDATDYNVEFYHPPMNVCDFCVGFGRINCDLCPYDEYYDN